MPEGTPRLIEVRKLGRVPYEDALALQQALVEKRRAGEIPDQLLLLEHPHVITLGSSSRQQNILLSPEELKARGIQVYEVGRGGDVTYHGPGQLVAYPILSLDSDRKDLHRYLRDLEEVVLESLAEFGIQGIREEGFTGVWVPEGKLAAIGVRVSSGWISSHGFSLNVDPDPAFFSTIIPCGIEGRPVASMSGLLGRPVTVDEVIPTVIRAFGSVFDGDLHVV
jgi:lipoyl(octanoyl) transferase